MIEFNFETMTCIMTKDSFEPLPNEIAELSKNGEVTTFNGDYFLVDRDVFVETIYKRAECAPNRITAFRIVRHFIGRLYPASENVAELVEQVRYEIRHLSEKKELPNQIPVKVQATRFPYENARISCPAIRLTLIEPPK